MTQDTSLTAYFHEVAPTLGARQIAVCEVFERVRDRDYTNSEIADILGWSINRVTGRVKELRNVTIIELSRVRRCGITGRRVQAWRIKNNPAISPNAIAQETTFHQFPASATRGRTHTVKDSGIRVSCTCKGFYFRGTCKHIEKAREKAPDPKEQMESLFK